MLKVLNFAKNRALVIKLNERQIVIGFISTLSFNNIITKKKGSHAIKFLNPESKKCKNKSIIAPYAFVTSFIPKELNLSKQ